MHCHQITLALPMVGSAFLCRPSPIIKEVRYISDVRCLITSHTGRRVMEDTSQSLHSSPSKHSLPSPPTSSFLLALSRGEPCHRHPLRASAPPCTATWTPPPWRTGHAARRGGAVRLRSHSNLNSKIFKMSSKVRSIVVKSNAITLKHD